MKFEPPLFHPNSKFQIHDWVAELEASTLRSLPRRECLHLNPSHAGRRSHNVWICLWAMEPRSERWKSHLERDFNVSRSAKPFSMPIYVTPILLLFLEPNLESGANIDCCKLYRENKAEYERIVRRSIKEQLGLWTSLDTKQHNKEALFIDASMEMSPVTLANHLP